MLHTLEYATAAKMNEPQLCVTLWKNDFEPKVQESLGCRYEVRRQNKKKEEENHHHRSEERNVQFVIRLGVWDICNILCFDPVGSYMGIYILFIKHIFTLFHFFACLF